MKSSERSTTNGIRDSMRSPRVNREPHSSPAFFRSPDCVTNREFEQSRAAARRSETEPSAPSESLARSISEPSAPLRDSQRSAKYTRRRSRVSEQYLTNARISLLATQPVLFSFRAQPN